jgi:aryl-alcohol dehydrogenase-like predicted oxidoreductase
MRLQRFPNLEVDRQVLQTSRFRKPEKAGPRSRAPIHADFQSPAPLPGPARATFLCKSHPFEMGEKLLMMPKRNLGRAGPSVSVLGLGCMGMSEFYGRAEEAESITTIHRAIGLGVNFLDTADVYGRGHNEQLVGRAIRDRREMVILATKFGNVRDDEGRWVGVNGRPEYVRSCCEASLRRLGLDTIDLYYQHRVDPDVPIEDTVGAMADLIKEGKVKMLGLSEASAATIRRAHEVHPIAVVQTEYSLWTRDVESEILPTTKDLGIAFVAYSPLGRGFLTGRFQRPEDIPADDYRRNSPRFQGENFYENLELVKGVEELAIEKGATPAQIALAWVLGQSENIVTIPGAKTRKHLEENLAAAALTLSTDELQRLEAIFPCGVTSGARYSEQAMRRVNI